MTKANIRGVLLLALVTGCAGTHSGGDVAAPRVKEDRPPISSEVVSPGQGELMLVQRVRIDAPKDRVWRAYTTEEGWRAWVAPVVEMDFRTGGAIRSHYDPSASIGDPGTILLHVRNYVPGELITLQAELSDAFPEFMKADADRMSNIVTFEEIDDGVTLLTSYGVGYGDSDQYRQLLAQFTKWNEQSYAKLKTWAEAP